MTLLLGGSLRFYQLGEKSLWTDELATMHNTGNIVDLKTFLAHTPEDDLPKFYSLILKFWMRLGESEFFMRSLSVIFGILSIPVIYASSRLFFDVRISLSAAFLTAISPFLLLYDREIRVYSLFTLLSLLSTYLFARSLRENKRYLWSLYALVNILNIYTHPYAFLTIGIQWLYLIIYNRSYRHVAKSWFVVNVAMLLFFSARLFQFIKDVAFFAPWAIPRERFPVLFGKVPAEYFYNFFSFSVGQTLLPWNPLAIPILIVVGGCFIIGLRRKMTVSREKLYLILLLFIPVAVGVIFRIGLPRYFTFIAPIFYLFVARGLWLLPRKTAVAGALMILLGWGWGLGNYYTDKEFHFMGSIDPWREVATFLKDNVQEDELVYAIGLGIVPLRYYYDGSISGFEGNALIKELEGYDNAGPKRIWLIFTYQEEYDNWLQARSILNKQYVLMREKKWAQDPDYMLKRKFFKKNFSPYRVVAEHYVRQ